MRVEMWNENGEDEKKAAEAAYFLFKYFSLDYLQMKSPFLGFLIQLCWLFLSVMNDTTGWKKILSKNIIDSCVNSENVLHIIEGKIEDENLR